MGPRGPGEDSEETLPRPQVLASPRPGPRGWLVAALAISAPQSRKPSFTWDDCGGGGSGVIPRAALPRMWLWTHVLSRRPSEGRYTRCLG